MYFSRSISCQWLAAACCALALPLPFGQAADPPTVLPPITVHEQLSTMGTLAVVHRDALTRGTVYELADAVGTAPGVTCVSRGASGGEPVIRGLGWERVTTQVNGLPVYGACPARMDPPLAYVGLHAADTLTIEKGIPSVAHGAGGTGGRISFTPGADAPRAPRREMGVAVDSARDGLVLDLSTQLPGDRLDASAAIDYGTYGDYESAGGVTVPAGLSEGGASLTVGLEPDVDTRLWSALILRRSADIDYPALPMDTEETESVILNLGARRSFDGAFLRDVELRAGVAAVDHLMNNDGKPNRKLMAAETPSDADARFLGAAASRDVSDASILRAGVDYTGLERDAVRTRRMVATGMRLTDHIWPDAEQQSLGAYAELSSALGERLALRLGARIDHATGEAGAADDSLRLGPMASPTTIRNAYVRFYGPDAADTDASDTLVSGNALLLWQVDDALDVYASVGRVARAPDVTSRYFAFAPSPGGYQVGNPTLDPEAKHTVELGASGRRGPLQLDMSVFATAIEDFIYQSQIASLDVDGDGKADRVNGFDNIDAEFFGGELAGVWHMTHTVSLPFSAAYVRGRNTTANRNLPEMPPLSGELALRYDADADLRWWAQCGAELVARQEKVDAQFPEDETPGFGVAHLRAGVTLQSGVSLVCGVENLFDKDYSRHLTREAVMPVGGLGAGDEIPEPGRYLYASARMAF